MTQAAESRFSRLRTAGIFSLGYGGILSVYLWLTTTVASYQTKDQQAAAGDMPWPTRDEVLIPMLLCILATLPLVFAYWYLRVTQQPGQSFGRSAWVAIMSLLRTAIVLAILAFVATGNLISFFASLVFAPFAALPVLPFLMIWAYWFLTPEKPD